MVRIQMIKSAVFMDIFMMNSNGLDVARKIK